MFYIINSLKYQADSKTDTTIHAFDAAQKATESALNILAKSFNNCQKNQNSSTATSNIEISNTASDDDENEYMSWSSLKDDDELKFHYIAHKKVLYIKCKHALFTNRYYF